TIGHPELWQASPVAARGMPFRFSIQTGPTVAANCTASSAYPASRPRCGRREILMAIDSGVTKPAPPPNDGSREIELDMTGKSKSSHSNLINAVYWLSFKRGTLHDRGSIRRSMSISMFVVHAQFDIWRL